MTANDSQYQSRTGDAPFWYRLGRGVFMMGLSVTMTITILLTIMLLSEEMKNPTPEEVKALDTAFSTLGYIAYIGFFLGVIEIVGPRRIQRVVRPRVSVVWSKTKEVLN